MNYKHIPVMLKEVMEYLNVKVKRRYIDCTLGGGGYTEAILKKAGNLGQVIGIDLDNLAIENARKKFKKEIKNKNLILINDNFKNLHQIINKVYPQEKIYQFAGIVFDLGLSSAQLEDRSRGFSFQLDAPLVMSFRHNFKIATNKKRIDTNNTAEFIVNKYSEEELIRILREYGEEKYAGKIAENITRERKNKKISTTGELVEIIKSAVPIAYQHRKIHFATKTFQALRIETNQELENLKAALGEAVDLLESKGRIVVISYHSLEDKIVKNYFKQEVRGCVCPPEIPECRCSHVKKIEIITKKPITPSEDELKNNPRSRSAKLRVAEKL